MSDSAREKKKKIDYGALSSPFMRIPHMDMRAARALLDLGFKEVYELRGRDPDIIFGEYKKMRPTASVDILKFIKNAVDFAEIEDKA